VKDLKRVKGGMARRGWRVSDGHHKDGICVPFIVLSRGNSALVPVGRAASANLSPS
jgi:hypothetical protein